MKYFTKEAFLLRKSSHFYEHMSGRSADMEKAVESVIKKIERSGKGPIAERAAELPGLRSQFKAIRLSTIRAENQYHKHIKDGMDWDVARTKLDDLTGMEFMEGKDRFVVSMRRSLDELRRGGQHTTPRGFTLVSPQPHDKQDTLRKGVNINAKLNKYDPEHAASKAFKVPGSDALDSEYHLNFIAAMNAKLGIK